MQRFHVHQIAIAVLVLPLLAGCSGAGAPADEISGGALQTLAQDHLSALMQFRTWVTVQYFKLPVYQPPPVVTPLPDGSTRFEHTNSDGSVGVFIVRPNGSETDVITWPDGFTVTNEWALVSQTSTLQVSQVSQMTSAGTRMEFTSSRGSSLQGYLVREGSFSLPDGRAAQFRLRGKVPNEPDELTVTLPDGSGLEYVLPLRLEPGAGGGWPNFATGATGVYTSAEGKRLNFTVTGDQEDDIWQRWTLTDEEGYEAEFTLEDDFAGSGEIRQNGSVVGALRWTAELEGTLEPLHARLEEVNPSATARDFRIERWVRNAAALSPMPMY